MSITTERDHLHLDGEVYRTWSATTGTSGTPSNVGDVYV
jgi:hypothetical protein